MKKASRRGTQRFDSKKSIPINAARMFPWNRPVGSLFLPAFNLVLCLVCVCVLLLCLFVRPFVCLSVYGFPWISQAEVAASNIFPESSCEGFPQNNAAKFDFTITTIITTITTTIIMTITIIIRILYITYITGIICIIYITCITYITT